MPLVSSVASGVQEAFMGTYGYNDWEQKLGGDCIGGDSRTSHGIRRPLEQKSQEN